MNKPFSLPKARSGYYLGRSCLLLLALVQAGCVQIEAPDKPIVINLNVAIRQEVIVKVDDAAKKAIETNSGIF